jgi:hypothetical protein
MPRELAVIPHRRIPSQLWRCPGARAAIAAAAADGCSSSGRRRRLPPLFRLASRLLGRSADTHRLPRNAFRRKEQKEAAVSKKIKFRKNFATIQDAVQLWEQLRPKTTSKEDKAALVERIVGMVRGLLFAAADEDEEAASVLPCAVHSQPALSYP